MDQSKFKGDLAHQALHLNTCLLGPRNLHIYNEIYEITTRYM